MRIVSCPSCHIQFDVTDVNQDELSCPCGEIVRNVSPTPVDAEIRRCGSCGASIGPDDEQCTYCESAIVRESECLSLICPECYARNAEEAAFCASCGVRFCPQPVVGDGQELNCPCCGREMKVRGIGGVFVHECTVCHGLWAPDDSFDHLIERAMKTKSVNQYSHTGGGGGDRPSRPFQSKVVYRQCPVCGGHMQRKNFARRSGVIMDWCGMHGTWLDANELEEIASFIATGGLEMANNDAAREINREGRAQHMIRADRMKRGITRTGPSSTVTAGSIGDLLEGLLGW
jgi:Zn-finger nucleic acid-binding protein/ribosomal protein L40E